jgi:hypothetical protein
MQSMRGANPDRERPWFIFPLGNVLFQPLNLGWIYDGKNKKICRPKMYGEKVHLSMTGKH